MKILIIQLRRIGDILLTTPVVSYLKQVFPDARIDFLAEPCGKSVLETNPKISQLLIVDKNHPWQLIQKIRHTKYDTIIDLMNNPRSTVISALSGSKWTVVVKKSLRSIFYNTPVSDPNQSLYAPVWKIQIVKSWLTQIGVQPPEPASIRPEIYPTKEDQNFANQWAKQNGRRKFAVLVPTHRHNVRRWSWEGFQKVGISLHHDHGLDVFLAWGPGEKTLINQIRKDHEKELLMLPETTIRQSFCIFQKANLVVTNDSGLMHTAVASGAPTVTIYGPTRSTDWNPSLIEKRSPPHDIPVSARDVVCLGCHLNECAVGHICMTHLTANEVLNACNQILQ